MSVMGRMGAERFSALRCFMVITYYVVKDPDTLEVVYVGQTILESRRGKQHLNASVSLVDGSKGQLVSKWAMQLAEQGKTPVFQVVGYLDLSEMAAPIARMARSEVERTLIERFADDAALKSRHIMNVVHNPFRDRTDGKPLLNVVNGECTPVKTEKGFACASRFHAVAKRVADCTR